MEEQHQHDNGGHGSAQVYESTVQSDAHGGGDLRDDRDQGHVRTFEAKAEERGKNADGGAAGKEPRQDRAQRRVGTFDANAQADRYVSAWPRQVAGFYGRRLRKNVEFGRRFAEVEGIADLLGLQREYVNDMLLDYASSFWSFYGLAGLGLRGAQQTAERSNR